jgi:CPA1 family monovalent cation:H+ antiporter
MQPDPDRLLRVPILAGLSDDERTRLASWLDVEEFADGTYLAHAGASEYQFLILDQGRARVERDGRTIVTLVRGDVFGEMAFFGDGRRSADVVAETYVRVLVMYGSRFRQMQTAMPDIAARLEELARIRSGPTKEG